MQGRKEREGVGKGDGMGCEEMGRMGSDREGGRGARGSGYLGEARLNSR